MTQPFANFVEALSLDPSSDRLARALVETRNAQKVGGYEELEQPRHRHVEEAILVVGEGESLTLLADRVVLDDRFLFA